MEPLDEPFAFHGAPAGICRISAKHAPDVFAVCSRRLALHGLNLSSSLSALNSFLTVLFTVAA